MTVEMAREGTWKNGSVEEEVAAALAGLVADFGLVSRLRSDGLYSLSVSSALVEFHPGERPIVDGAVAIIVQGVVTAAVAGRPRIFRRGDFVNASRCAGMRTLTSGAAIYCPYNLVSQLARSAPAFGVALMESLRNHSEVRSYEVVTETRSLKVVTEGSSYEVVTESGSLEALTEAR